MKKATYALTLLVILLTFAATFAAARFGVYAAIRNDQAVQVVNVDTGWRMNYVPEPNVWSVFNEKGERVYIGPEGRAVECFRFSRLCP